MQSIRDKLYAVMGQKRPFAILFLDNIMPDQEGSGAFGDFRMISTLEPQVLMHVLVAAIAQVDDEIGSDFRFDRLIIPSPSLHASDAIPPVALGTLGLSHYQC